MWCGFAVAKNVWYVDDLCFSDELRIRLVRIGHLCVHSYYAPCVGETTLGTSSMRYNSYHH